MLWMKEWTHGPATWKDLTILKLLTLLLIKYLWYSVWPEETPKGYSIVFSLQTRGFQHHRYVEAPLFSEVLDHRWVVTFPRVDSEVYYLVCCGASRTSHNTVDLEDIWMMHLTICMCWLKNFADQELNWPVMFWRVVESLVSETFLLTSHHTAPTDQGVSIPVVSGTSAAHTFKCRSLYRSPRSSDELVLQSQDSLCSVMCMCKDFCCKQQ